MSFFYSTQLFDLILSQVLWQGVMALSLLSLWCLFDRSQWLIDFLDVTFNLFGIHPSIHSMTTKQTDIEQGLSGLIHGIWCNWKHQTSVPKLMCWVCRKIHAFTSAFLRHFCTCIHASYTEVPSFNLFPSSPEEEAGFISSYAYTPPVSHFWTCLGPRILEKLALS